MIRVAVTAAYEAIAATLPLGGVGYEVERRAESDQAISHWEACALHRQLAACDAGAVNPLYGAAI